MFRFANLFVMSVGLFLLLANPAKAEKLSHQLVCKVKDHSSLAMNDGKLVRDQKAHQKNLTTDTKLLLEITSGRDQVTLPLPIRILLKTIDIQDSNRGKQLLWIDSSEYSEESIEMETNLFHTGNLKPNGRGGSAGVPDSFWFTKDDLFIHSYFFGMTLKLSRYYKSDWNGVLTEIRPTKDSGYYSDTWALDCRTQSDQLGQMLARLNSVSRTQPSQRASSEDPEANTRNESNTFLISDLLPKQEAKSYPQLPFAESVGYLASEFPRDQEDQYFQNMIEVSLRCAGMFTLLARQQALDSLSKGSREGQIADVLQTVGGLWFFQTTFGDAYANKSEDEFESFMISTVGQRVGIYGETYAQWINEHLINVSVLNDPDHPFTKEYAYCSSFGETVLEGSKLLQGE